MAVNWNPFRRRQAPAALEEKAAAIPFIGGWKPVSWLTPTFQRLAHDGYGRNAAVFACVETLAMSYPEPPPVVVSERDDSPLPDHPLARLLSRPNPLMSWSELDVISITYRAIGGSCYLHKVRSAGGRVVELWPYHGGQIRPIPSADGWVRGYEYIGPGDYRAEIPATDVIHVKWPSVDPDQPWLPLPPLVAAAREVDTDTEIGRYLYALLSNDATPPTVIKIPGQLTPTQFERLRQSWEQRHGGRNRGRVAVLEHGADIARLGLAMDELAWEALRAVPEARIAAAFRIPAVIVGLGVGLDRATYANFQEAGRVYTKGTLVPMWTAEAVELTQALAAEFGGGVRVERDLSKVDALQESADAVFQRALSAWDGGLITRNEARTMLGLPRVEDLVLAPGAPALPPGDIFTETAAPVALPTLPAPVDVTPDGQRAQDLRHLSAKDRAFVERKADSTDPIEGSIRQAVQRYLSQEYRQAADGVGGATGTPAEIVDQLGLDLGPGIATLMRRFYRLLVGAAWEDAGAALTLDLVFDLDNPLIQGVLSELAQLVTRVAETTREEIRALVGRQAAEGWGVDRLAREIRQAGIVRSPVRARIIAQTETASAYSLGSKAAYRAAGVVSGVRWLTTEGACPICKPLDGKVTPLEGGDFGEGIFHPPAHPTCRCAIAPVVG